MRHVRIVLVLVLVACGLAVAASALAATGAQQRSPSLAQALARTVAAGSERFDLTVRVAQPNGLPRALHVTGAAAGALLRLHLQVFAVAVPATAAAPATADEVVDGSFLYLRSPLTRSAVGPLWIRVPLTSRAASSTELKSIHSVAPPALLGALARAQDVTSRHGVLRAVLPFGDPVVAKALAGVEAGVQYRRLRATVTLGRDGLVHRVLVTGRTPDGSSRLALLLLLRNFGRPVVLQPPKAGQFVDFDLSRLSS